MSKTDRTCLICEKEFPFKSYLKRHLRVHSENKPFNCDHCGQKFSRKDTLTRHIRIHTGEKPFKCEYCDKKFTQKTSLRNHWATSCDSHKRKTVVDEQAKRARRPLPTLVEITPLLQFEKTSSLKKTIDETLKLFSHFHDHCVE